MRQFFLFFLIAAAFINGQNVPADSSVAFIAADSVNISDIVRDQIERAKMKQSAVVIPEVVREAGLDVKNEPVKTEKNKPLSVYASLPIQYQIFIAASILVLLILAIRRTLLVMKKKSSRGLKIKIAMLRDEKIVVRTNSKLASIRRKLKGGREILDASEAKISKVAKDLNIAKGELLLASRMKLYELGKM